MYPAYSSFFSGFRYQIGTQDTITYQKNPQTVSSCVRDHLRFIVGAHSNLLLKQLRYLGRTMSPERIGFK